MLPLLVVDFRQLGGQVCDGLPRAPLALNSLKERESRKTLALSGSWLGENMNCKVVPVLLGILALTLLASIAHADSITESNTTTDGTSVAVNSGQGETFFALSMQALFPVRTPINLPATGGRTAWRSMR
jgi:hypothetical protein